MKPSKKQLALERRWVGKRVLARFRDIPEKRGEPCPIGEPEPGVVTCICDNSADLENGDRRRRSVPTGTAMIRLDRPAAQCEYETDLDLLELEHTEGSNGQQTTSANLPK